VGPGSAAHRKGAAQHPGHVVPFSLTDTAPQQRIRWTLQQFNRQIVSSLKQALRFA
jgi:hypothetical protein